MNRWIAVLSITTIASAVGCAGQTEATDEGTNGTALQTDDSHAETAQPAKEHEPPAFTPTGSLDSSGDVRAEGVMSPDAAPCWHSGSHWWCNNRSGAPVRASSTGTIVGYMYSTTSWFSCRAEGGYNGTHTHPNRWEWTQADNGKWGWMGDGDISNETNSLPVCR